MNQLTLPTARAGSQKKAPAPMPEGVVTGAGAAPLAGSSQASPYQRDPDQCCRAYPHAETSKKSGERIQKIHALTHAFLAESACSFTRGRRALVGNACAVLRAATTSTDSAAALMTVPILLHAGSSIARGPGHHNRDTTIISRSSSECAR